MAAIPFSSGQSTTEATGLTTFISVTASASLTSSSTTHKPTTTTVKVGVNHDFQPDTVSALPGDVISKFQMRIDAMRCDVMRYDYLTLL